VVLKSTKDRILGVDTLGLHVSPRVWYGMASLLIRYAIGCVSCSVDWDGIIHCDLPEPHGARGDVCAGNLSTAIGDHLFRKPYQIMTYFCSRPL
jgi:hypothetical protein